jgi:DNA-binding NarL/FixJ family response regulator
LDLAARLLAGNRVSMIARDLDIAQSTVYNHHSHAFSKLNVSDHQRLIERLAAATNLPIA